MYLGGNAGMAINPWTRIWISLAAAILLICGPRNAGTPGPAGAEKKSPPKGSVIVPAGKTFTLTKDLELSGDAVFEVNGTPGKRCVLIGNNHRIKTRYPWKGRLRITHCDIRKLGTKEGHALDIGAHGNAEITIENSRFDESSSIHLVHADTSTVRFRHNVVLENSLVPAVKLIDKSRSVFVAEGNSPRRKLFQGNHVYKSSCQFSGNNWLIGGDGDADSNVVIGLRAAIAASRGENIVIKGNYVCVPYPSRDTLDTWSQVCNLSVYQVKGAVTEHNVLRHAHWNVRGIGGEFRDNVVIDVFGHHWIVGPEPATKIHHNIFVQHCKPWAGESGIAVIYPGDGIEIYNNTLDGGGKLLGAAVEVSDKCAVKSLRNNVFFNFNQPDKFYRGPNAMIRWGWNEVFPARPARLGYADYNLFYSPRSRAKRNYLLEVAGKTERKDAGFARNDLPKNGKPNDRIDPRFAGPVPTEFPFSQEDIKAKKVTVAQILAHYRKAYTPEPRSPLIGAGDPADGAKSAVGAVGPGKLKK
jgi:hypothetical protein